MKLTEICAQFLNTEMTGFHSPKYEISEKDGKITYRFYAEMTLNPEDILKESDIYNALQRHLFDTSRIDYVRGLRSEIRELEKYKNHYELELEKLKVGSK